MDENTTEQAGRTPVTIRLEDYRPPAFTITHTELCFVLGESGSTVRARLHVTRLAPGATTLELHAENMTVKRVAIDGVALDSARYVHAGDCLRIADVPAQFVLETENDIHPESNTTLNGLYRSRTMFCTQCEPHGFRTITPYLDRPDVLSTFNVRIEADAAQFPVLLSNGNPVETGTLPHGRHFAEWSDPFPKPSYLFALVAGDLERVTDRFTTQSGREVALHIYVEAKDLNKVTHALTSLKQAMRWDEEAYGREYDLDLFQIVAVDDFNMGAMENKGLNIFNTSAVLANPAITTDMRFQWIQAVVGHEYFHNWSGNRVTCRDWFQLSLKEGFTVYRDNQFSAAMNSPDVKRIEHVRMLKSHQFAEDAGPLAHPVQPPSYQEINNFYTLTIYEKGSEVVRMQANLLGAEAFRQATDLYFDRFDGKAATIEDFVGCMTEVSGRDMRQFMNWYRQAGTPVVDVEDLWDQATGTYTLKLKQSCPPTPEAAEKAPFVIPVRIGLVGEHGDIPFRTSEEANAPSVAETVLDFHAEAQTFTLYGVNERPVPSLLRDFSAPVRLRNHIPDADLAHLIAHDSNGFNRWDASQQLAERIIIALQNGAKDAGAERLVEAFETVLAGPETDGALVASMLQLPSIEALVESVAASGDPLELDALYTARRQVRELLARSLSTQFADCYSANQSNAAYAPSASQIAQRALKNTALAYWVASGSDDALAACADQFHNAGNMTDASAALATLVNAHQPAAEGMAESALAAFFARWKDESLVVNQWFSVQASSQRSGNLARVEALMQHEAFDIRNPNKVRSLIGGFCGLDPENFHNPDGSGYRFLREQILHVDVLNPQTAARLVTPLSRWKRFDGNRQTLMQAELERLAAADLSRDVREMVEKSLR